MTTSRFSPLTRRTVTLAAILMFSASGLAETVIYRFQLSSSYDGDGPFGTLVKGKHGTFYGTTSGGGAYSVYGTIFELTPPTVSGGDWTETILYSFQGEPDGISPVGLAIDGEGNLYGATILGGANNAGCVFELTPPTASGGAWTETVLHSFNTPLHGSTDGYEPDAGVVVGWEGSLYGTTAFGGAFGFGTVFRLTKLNSGVWREGIIHNFRGSGNGDGELPFAGLIHDEANNLYGATAEGGSGGCAPVGCGTVYELSPPTVPNNPWTETILYSFTGPANGDGFYAQSPLVFDSAGNLYGTTAFGGLEMGSCAVDGCGTVFEVSPVAGGGWTESVLYSFTDGSDGASPEAGLVIDSAGNLYGTALLGGRVARGCSTGCGTVFELSPTGGAWAETTLHEFRTGYASGDDGFYPAGGLVFGLDGSLYGVTGEGGEQPRHNAGTVYSIHP